MAEYGVDAVVVERDWLADNPAAASALDATYREAYPGPDSIVYEPWSGPPAPGPPGGHQATRATRHNRGRGDQGHHAGVHDGRSASMATGGSPRRGDQVVSPPGAAP